MLQVILWNESYQDQSKRHVLPGGLSQSVCFGEQSVPFYDLLGECHWSWWHRTDQEGLLCDWLKNGHFWSCGGKLAKQWLCITDVSLLPQGHHTKFWSTTLFFTFCFFILAARLFFIMFKLLLLNSSSVFLKVFQRFSLDMGCFVTYF